MAREVKAIKLLPFATSKFSQIFAISLRSCNLCFVMVLAGLALSLTLLLNAGLAPPQSASASFPKLVPNISVDQKQDATVGFVPTANLNANSSWLRTRSSPDSDIAHQTQEAEKRLCNRLVPNSERMDTTIASFNHQTADALVVVGGGFSYGQTNNIINTLLHATDYAADIGADLAIYSTGYLIEELRMLFLSDRNSNNSDERDKNWELEIENKLGIKFYDSESMDSQYPNIFHSSSQNMYFYHTPAPVSTILKRRTELLRFLWSNPSRGVKNSEKMLDMCSVVNSVVSPNEKYVVIHARWMSHDVNDGCTARLSDSANHMCNVDPYASCAMSPEYVKSILRPIGMLNHPIFLITDGLRPETLADLQSDKEIGDLVRTVPESDCWVGGDMMLAILADVFIGSPVSTMSGNIAKARMALGFDPSSNYLFMKRSSDKQGLSGSTLKTKRWETACSIESLYHVNIMKSYVG